MQPIKKRRGLYPKLADIDITFCQQCLILVHHILVTQD